MVRRCRPTGRQAAARRTIARASAGEAIFWPRKCHISRRPPRSPAKTPFVGFLASNHGQSFPARASRKRPIGGVTFLKKRAFLEHAEFPQKFFPCKGVRGTRPLPQLP